MRGEPCFETASRKDQVLASGTDELCIEAPILEDVHREGWPEFGEEREKYRLEL